MCIVCLDKIYRHGFIEESTEVMLPNLEMNLTLQYGGVKS